MRSVYQCGHEISNSLPGKYISLAVALSSASPAAPWGSSSGNTLNPSWTGKEGPNGSMGPKSSPLKNGLKSTPKKSVGNDVMNTSTNSGSASTRHGRDNVVSWSPAPQDGSTKIKSSPLKSALKNSPLKSVLKGSSGTRDSVTGGNTPHKLKFDSPRHEGKSKRDTDVLVDKVGAALDRIVEVTFPSQIRIRNINKAESVF